MKKDIEFLTTSIITLSKKIEQLEKWCVKHEVEGMEYGNEFEERDANLIDLIDNLEADLAERINLLAETVIAIDEKLSRIHEI